MTLRTETHRLQTRSDARGILTVLNHALVRVENVQTKIRSDRYRNRNTRAVESR